MRPDFGCGIHDLVFEQNTAATAGRVTQSVKEALLRFEPRIELLDVRWSCRDGNGEVLQISDRLSRARHQHRLQPRVPLLSRNRWGAMTNPAPSIDTRTASDVTAQIKALLKVYAPAYKGAGLDPVSQEPVPDASAARSSESLAVSRS